LYQAAFSLSSSLVPLIPSPVGIIATLFIEILAEVTGTARVNLQSAEHLKNVSFSF